MIDHGLIDHDFLPVKGHPDDDECTYRADGTDDTYCGFSRAAHKGPAFRHEWTDEIVCPHCGCEHGDSWERADGIYNDGKTDCEECGEQFLWERIVTVVYCTKKSAPEGGGRE